MLQGMLIAGSEAYAKGECGAGCTETVISTVRVFAAMPRRALE